jgi:hypothetical protein
MPYRAAFNWRSGAEDEHQDNQRHEDELNVLFLDFGNDGGKTNESVFHGSPFVEWDEILSIDYPIPGYKGDYSIKI